MNNYTKYLEISKNKRFGKPVIKGTRISVYDVLLWFSNGMTREEIILDFPELTNEMLNACLGFAANKERTHLYA
jgi:uncharacterized protein (DUF433 family)